MVNASLREDSPSNSGRDKSLHFRKTTAGSLWFGQFSSCLQAFLRKNGECDQTTAPKVAIRFQNLVQYWDNLVILDLWQIQDGGSVSILALGDFTAFPTIHGVRLGIESTMFQWFFLKVWRFQSVWGQSHVLDPCFEECHRALSPLLPTSRPYHLLIWKDRLSSTYQDSDCGAP